MQYKTLSLDIQEKVALLRLNRPSSRNAMNDEMASEFSNAVEALGTGGEAGAVVLTGAGSAFCAGGDLQGFPKWAGMAPAEVERQLRAFYAGFLRVMDLSIPTIAALNGPAVGAGACLAAACDMRLAAESARIGFTFVKLGINPGMGSEYLLRRLVGPARTVELLMTGEVLSAARAERMGLVNRVVPDKSLLETAMETARKLTRLPFSILKVIKENTVAASTEPIDEILRQEAKHQAPIFTDPRFQEKVRRMLKELGRGENPD